ncbi:MAG TPA: hypothetical protein VLE91_02230, partial [Candidatus Saccharimonadales bacterium]|nr:hypothetical protein [Candidatus Saccharimonadales bacterium]
IVRIATAFDSQGYWQHPTDEDAKAWADFFAKLYFPTKNKYIQVYNEVNRAAEWGGKVDASDYAKELDKTINALKAKNSDFFVLEAPLDLALGDSSSSVEAGKFFDQMDAAVPGIFSRLDGWASHSYPNPGFSASPVKSGRTGIDGYKWELEQISAKSGNKDLPVFITETGWSRAALSEETVASYYKEAFGGVWGDKRVVAVTPFIFDFSGGPFENFSFRNDPKVQGAKYYSQYQAIANLPKAAGAPVRSDTAEMIKIYLPKYVIAGSENVGQMIVKNTGNYIWSRDDLAIASEVPSVNFLGIQTNKEKVIPGDTVVVSFKFSPQARGVYDFNPTLVDGVNYVSKIDWQLVSESYSQRAIRVVKGLFRV